MDDLAKSHEDFIKKYPDKFTKSSKNQLEIIKMLRAERIGKKRVKEEVEQIDELSNKLLKNYTKKVKDEHDAIVDAEMQMPYDRLNPLKSSRYKGYTRASSILHNRRINKEEVEVLDEKAVSQAQQRFMGMVHATQKGDIVAPSSRVAKVAASIPKKAAKDFASTKLAGLPGHVGEEKENEETELNETSRVTKYLKNKHAIGVGAKKARYQGPSHQLNAIAALQKGREILKGKQANEEVEDIEEAKKSPWDKLNARLKTHGYDADEVLKRPAPEQKKDEKPSEKEKTNEELSRAASMVKEVYHRAKAEAKAKDARRGGPQSTKRRESFNADPEMNILPYSAEKPVAKK